MEDPACRTPYQREELSPLGPVSIVTSGYRRDVVPDGCLLWQSSLTCCTEKMPNQQHHRAVVGLQFLMPCEVSGCAASVLPNRQNFAHIGTPNPHFEALRIVEEILPFLVREKPLVLVGGAKSVSIGNGRCCQFQDLIVCEFDTGNAA